MIHPIRDLYPTYRNNSHNSTPKKNNKPDCKVGRGSEEIFLQERHTDGQQANEKVFNATNHEGNANQNHNKTPPYTCQNSYYQTENK